MGGGGQQGCEAAEGLADQDGAGQGQLLGDGHRVTYVRRPRDILRKAITPAVAPRVVADQAVGGAEQFRQCVPLRRVARQAVQEQNRDGGLLAGAVLRAHQPYAVVRRDVRRDRGHVPPPVERLRT